MNTNQKMFLKIVISCVICLACASLFSGCEPKKIEGQRQITIRYGTIEIYPQQQEMIRKIVNLFEKKYPDIKVKVETDPKYEKILVEIAGNTAPDVFFWQTDRLKPLVKGDSIRDLDEFVQSDKDFSFEDFFPEGVRACQHEGRTYALPVHLEAGVLYYNKNMFELDGIHLPDTSWTWGTFLEAAERLTKDLDNDGRIDRYGTLPVDVWFHIRRYGGQFLNEENTQCLFDRQEAIEAVQASIDLMHKYRVAPLVSLLRDASVEIMFGTGRIAMMEGLPYYLIQFREFKNFEWGIAHLPKGKKRVTRLAVALHCMSNQSKHPDAAWKWMKFWTSPEIVALRAGARNSIPVLKSVAQSAGFLSPPPEGMKIFEEIMPYTEPYNVTGVDNFEEMLYGIIIPTFQQADIGEKRPEEVMNDIVKNVNARLKR